MKVKFLFPFVLPSCQPEKVENCHNLVYMLLSALVCIISREGL